MKPRKALIAMIEALMAAFAAGSCTVGAVAVVEAAWARAVWACVAAFFVVVAVLIVLYVRTQGVVAQEDVTAG